jgi:hypothetical protein
MEREKNVVPPSTQPVIRGRLQKTCGSLLRYASRTVELHAGGLYVFLDGMQAPYSTIALAGCSVINNSDSASGFSLIASETDDKAKFLCDSVDVKQKWIEHLHAAITEADAGAAECGVTRHAAQGIARHALDRSGAALVEGSVLRRGGISSYNVRWCEVWRGVGLAWAKYKSAADDDFKVLPLLGAVVSVNHAKMRVSILRHGAAHHLRFDSAAQLALWQRAIEGEAGVAAGAAQTAALRIARPQSPVGGAHHAGIDAHESPQRFEGDTDLDSDVELELADLMSDEPILSSKIVVEIPAVSRTLRADKDTPGFDAVLEARLAAIGAYGFYDVLKLFEQKMNIPLFGPFAALCRHINNLDLDASLIRKELLALLDAHGAEVKVAVVAERANSLLCHYTRAREVYLVRRDISEFREQRDQHGLRLGVNGSLKFVDDICRKRAAGKQRPEDVAKMEKLNHALQACLSQFRVDYDMFDDAYFTIEEMEVAMGRAQAWLDDADAALNAPARDPRNDADL